MPLKYVKYTQNSSSREYGNSNYATRDIVCRTALISAAELFDGGSTLLHRTAAACQMCSTGSAHSVARIFAAGVHCLLDQKSDDLFVVVTRSFHPILHDHVRQIPPPAIPFYLVCGVHLTKFTSFLPHFDKKCLEKIFFVALGVHLHPWLRLFRPQGLLDHQVQHSLPPLT